MIGLGWGRAYGATRTMPGVPVSECQASVLPSPLPVAAFLLTRSLAGNYWTQVLGFLLPTREMAFQVPVFCLLQQSGSGLVDG